MSMPIVPGPSHLNPITPTEKGSSETVTERTNSVASSIFRFITWPLKVPLLFVAIPLQALGSGIYGLVAGAKAELTAEDIEKAKASSSNPRLKKMLTTAKKCALFGATFFFRLLASSLAFFGEIKGGKSYDWRNDIEPQLTVSSLPFKSEVKELSAKLKKGDKKFDKAALLNQIETLNIPEDVKQKIIDQVNAQNGPFMGLVVDVTEREELTPIMTKGRPAEKEDWEKENILYINMPSEDMKALDIEKNLALAKFANLFRDNQVNVLVHCAKGIGRSVGVALTMMATTNERADVTTCIARFKEKRAYGLNDNQELAVYASKLLDELTQLKYSYQREVQTSSDAKLSYNDPAYFEECELKLAQLNKALSALQTGDTETLEGIKKDLNGDTQTSIDQYLTAFDKVSKSALSTREDKTFKDREKAFSFCSNVLSSALNEYQRLSKSTDPYDDPYWQGKQELTERLKDNFDGIEVALKQKNFKTARELLEKIFKAINPNSYHPQLFQLNKFLGFYEQSFNQLYAGRK